MKKIFYVLLVSCVGLTIIISCKEGDDIKRASNGFESAITFMYSEDRSDLIPKFKQEIVKYDNYRKEDFKAVFPELIPLFKTFPERS